MNCSSRRGSILGAKGEVLKADLMLDLIKGLPDALQAGGVEPAGAEARSKGQRRVRLLASRGNRIRSRLAMIRGLIVEPQKAASSQQRTKFAEGVDGRHAQDLP